ncbi:MULTISPECIES: 30S ribosomal protein S4 [Pyrobaculum]|uniref:Small ribosomal subunit protein uS4 n=3 Tax=Pyrobaculum TaxID=2276 RepID=RS4_PYRAR|nr:30S ribosomal protein S4 [Pyrobaculum arsenaticum]A4WM27.1 RecName: Full=Small ribosomal subunit protein uS4; AltName: Full=30S ribosomal protein S4 [Pyrobaculum arsenaticum DSM 13514]AFA38259.1 ribosomal protein S4(archaeal type)/S9(eukaryote cytosolic type) [Pyrobaculum oguniense TE7]ABP51444.1 SSU ribosomal protein S4P [Pyrobaculum arsenaticum DSM 13514]MCY0890916.1 30S ribosomal protein S4 [Pyrobaculum arsenaticum]NYR16590.1 30S ribosomal protein S4 [Pyrobaculum arsenaticum]
MGGLRKPKKKYLAGKPKKIWNKQLLLEELQLMGEYGLRNKRELWLARARLKWITRRARSLLSMTAEERAPLEMPFKEKLYKAGFIEDPNVPLDRILSLDVRAILERRLQTIVYRMGLAKSIYHARQLIVHGHIAIEGRRVTSPGFLVPRELEDKITLVQ